MRKVIHIVKVIFIVISALVVTGVLLVFVYNRSNDPIIREFRLMENKIILESFPSDEQVGAIDCASTANTNVRQLLEKHHGRDISKKYKYTIIAYDDETDTWMVNCSLISPAGRYCGRIAARTPGAIVRSDGRVLAVWD